MKTNKVATYGLLIALAFIFSYIEALIPIPLPVPGMKLGLANMVVMIAFYKMGSKEALVLSVLRIILAGFTFGNLYSLFYSMAGGLLSWFVMMVSKKTGKLSMIGVSVLGGISHNIGQIIIAMIIVENMNLIYYLPFLLISGLVTGALIGLLASIIIKHLKNV